MPTKDECNKNIYLNFIAAFNCTHFLCMQLNKGETGRKYKSCNFVFLLLPFKTCNMETFRKVEKIKQKVCAIKSSYKI